MTLADLPARLNFPDRSGGARLPRLLAMTDDNRLADPLALLPRLPAGSGLIFRHYDAPDREGLARRLAAAARRRGITVIVGDDPDLAARIGADGVHFPEYRMRRFDREACQCVGRFAVVTAAAHSLGAALRAQGCGVTAVVLSPVFATASHPDRAALGPPRFAAIVRHLRLPVYALGGVGGRSAGRVMAAGAFGIAGIGLFSAGGNG